MASSKNGCSEETLVCIMKVRTLRVGLCNNPLLLFPQDQRAQEISVACLLFLEMTATLWQLLCPILFKTLGCCFMNLLWFFGCQSLCVWLSTFPKVAHSHSNTGYFSMSALVMMHLFSPCCCCDVGLKKKRQANKSPCVKITSMACAHLCGWLWTPGDGGFRQTNLMFSKSGLSIFAQDYKAEFDANAGVKTCLCFGC